MMAPGIEVKPPRINTGKALRAMISRAKETSERAPHMMPVDQRHDARREPHDHPDLLSEMPTDSRGLVVVGHGPQRPSDAGLVEEHGQRCHHDHRDDGGGDVELLQDDELARDLETGRCPRQTQFLGDHHLRLAAEHELAEADQER
jgi:hypothetical protein